MLEVPLAEGRTRTVELVMTPEEWEDLVTIPHGSFEQAAAEVRRSVEHLDLELRYLVYQLYELVPSSAPVLPVNPTAARLDALSQSTVDPPQRSPQARG